jgi:hypothetical protein
MRYLLVILTLLIQAPAAAQEGPCTGPWQSKAQVARGIRCVWERFDAGPVRKALEVARCESGLDPHADGGASEGLYQHIKTYWPSRFAHYIMRHPRRSSWGLSASIWSGRSQAIVTALMTRRGGWGPWSCA